MNQKIFTVLCLLAPIASANQEGANPPFKGTCAAITYELSLGIESRITHSGLVEYQNPILHEKGGSIQLLEMVPEVLKDYNPLPDPIWRVVTKRLRGEQKILLEFTSPQNKNERLSLDITLSATYELSWDLTQRVFQENYGVTLSHGSTIVGKLYFTNPAVDTHFYLHIPVTGILGYPRFNPKEHHTNVMLKLWKSGLEDDLLEFYLPPDSGPNEPSSSHDFDPNEPQTPPGFNRISSSE